MNTWRFIVGQTGQKKSTGYYADDCSFLIVMKFMDTSKAAATLLHLQPWPMCEKSPMTSHTTAGT